MTEKNAMTIQDLQIIEKAHMLKIRLASKQQADKIKNSGIKLFSQIIPSYNINIEEYRPVTQCYRCYKFDHRTNQCKATEDVCSKCAATGHTHKNCNSSTLKCLNCDGNHAAVSFRCPVKKTEQKNQNSPAPQTTTPTISYANAATTNTTPAPSSTSTSTAAKNTSSPDHSQKLLLADQIIQYAIRNSFGNLQIQTDMINELFTSNNLPNITFPSNFAQKYQKHFTANYKKDNTEPEQTIVPATPDHDENPPSGESTTDTDTESENEEPTEPHHPSEKHHKQNTNTHTRPHSSKPTTIKMSTRSKNKHIHTASPGDLPGVVSKQLYKQ